MPGPGRGRVRRAAGAVGDAGPRGCILDQGTADRAERKKANEEKCGPVLQRT